MIDPCLQAAVHTTRQERAACDNMYVKPTRTVMKPAPPPPFSKEQVVQHWSFSNVCSDTPAVLFRPRRRSWPSRAHICAAACEAQLSHSWRGLYVLSTFPGPSIFMQMSSCRTVCIEALGYGNLWLQPPLQMKDVWPLMSVVPLTQPCMQSCTVSDSLSPSFLLSCLSLSWIFHPFLSPAEFCSCWLLLSVTPLSSLSLSLSFYYLDECEEGAWYWSVCVRVKATKRKKKGFSITGYTPEQEHRGACFLLILWSLKPSGVWKWFLYLKRKPALLHVSR